MKTKISILLILGMAFTVISCNSVSSSEDANIIQSSSTADNPKGKGDGPIMTFEKTTWDFKTLVEGDVVEHEYGFKNTGNKPLLISDVQASCGCTIPEWPRVPILPGQEGVILVRFNSAGKHENINKEVTIYSNANPIKKKLMFTAYVKNKPENKSTK